MYSNTKNIKEKIVFEEVVPTDKQIEILYSMLKDREHSISLKKNISYNEHKKFVNSMPYRVWYIVKYLDSFLGSFYLSKSNTIGINISTGDKMNAMTHIIAYINSRYKPLPEIPSVRASNYTINISPFDKELIKIIESLGGDKVQLTYSIPKLM